MCTYNGNRNDTYVRVYIEPGQAGTFSVWNLKKSQHRVC